MSKSILEKTSFSIIRTNPRLTSNVRLITDSRDRMYLESFSVNDELSKSKYKGFKVSSNSDYYFDLFRFYNNKTTFSKEIAFQLFEKDNGLSLKDKYGLQYDTTYGYGAKAIPSKLYDEEFSMFAPMWIEPNNIPDYFIICRLEDPVSVNTKNSATEFDQNVFDQITDPKNFTKNILDKSTIISSFDLTNESNLGRYIRKHANNIDFPEASVLANWEKDKYFEYNGINLARPGFISKKVDMYYESWPNDKTIIEFENSITDGFAKSGIAHPNVLNLEFLFDDEDATKYTFNRYFGLYVNKAQYNEFFIDGNKLFDDRFNQPTQLPVPIKNDVGYKDNIEDQIQINSNGIYVYAETPVISSLPGATAFFPNQIVNGEARIGYCQDAAGNFHKIKNNSAFPNDTLQLNDTTINWKDFSGFQAPENYVNAEFNYSVKGRPACVIEFTSQPINDDEFRIYFTDPNDLSGLDFIDNFTMTASNTIPLRTSVSNAYSTLGSTDDIAIAFSSAVNHAASLFNDLLSIRAIAIGSKVVIFSRVPSETWNKIKVTSFSQSVLSSNIAIKFISGIDSNGYVSTTYQSSPQPFTPVIGWLASGNFVGGNDNTKAKIKVSSDDTSLFSTDKYLVTNKGYSKIKNVVPYLDQPVRDNAGRIIGFTDFEKYFTVNIEDNTNEDIQLTSSSQAVIVPLRFNNCGLLSIYPIKDFDFDFFNIQYDKDADANVTKLRNFYLGQTGPFGQTSAFDPSAPGLTGSTGWIDQIIGPSSAFVDNGEFSGLMGISNLIDDTDSVIYNEYDRLKENDIKEFALDSRVVPFINKWVYDDGSKDVRENPYRLNSNAAFRYPNFGPSFREFDSNPKFFTHEWYYLQKYPPYMSIDERIDSFSYFNDAINIGATTYSGATADLGLTTVISTTGTELDDYFTEYFTREIIFPPNQSSGIAVNQEVRYSTFAYGTEARFPETVFRGAKVVIKERFDKTPINFNINKQKLKRGTKYNDYKFACCLSLVDTGVLYKIIENEKFKTITLLVEAGLRNENFTKIGGTPIGSTSADDYFIDRSLIYTLRDQIEIDAVSGNYEPSNQTLSGALYYWEPADPSLSPNVDPASCRLYFTTNTLTGTIPDLFNELSLNEQGAYNRVVIPNPTNPAMVWVADGISQVSSDVIICDTFQEYDAATISVLQSTNLFIAPLLPPPSPPNFTGIFDATGLWKEVPTYLDGGYRGYANVINQLSFAEIADSINRGDPNVVYITVKEDGTVVENDKLLELSIPTEAVKANYLVPREDTEVPNQLDSILSGDVAGFRMGASQDAVLNIQSRYNGRYQPKFNNLAGFTDYRFRWDLEKYKLGTLDLKYGTRYYGFDKYMNLEFNVEDPNFFNLKNYFYNKVNPENPSGVLKLSDTNRPSLYPKIGEVAVDKRNMYLWLSNWDMNYYQKAVDRTTEEKIIGYRGTIENKAFFSSKIMSIPDSIRLENWEVIELSDLAGGLSDITNVSANVARSDNKTSTPKPSQPAGNSQPAASNAKTDKKELILDVFTTKALTKYLRADGIDSEFIEYVNPSFSFGELGLDDDIEQYIANNIFERYEIKQIIFYESIYKNNVFSVNELELNLTNKELLEKGFKISENLSVKFFTDSPLNFKLIYNIPKLNNYSISFKVDLVKK